MAKNKMAEVAKLLGVELNEEFGIENSNYRYKFTNYGLRKRYLTVEEWATSCMLEDLLLGRVEIVKAVKPILDDVERRYLSNIIKPFRKQVISISKRSINYGEFINIMIDEGELVNPRSICLPYFIPGKMYKNMKVNREYTLDQLGL